MRHKRHSAEVTADRMRAALAAALDTITEGDTDA